MSAPASQLQDAQAWKCIQKPERVFGRGQRPVLGQRRAAVEFRRDVIPARAIDREETFSLCDVLNHQWCSRSNSKTRGLSGSSLSRTTDACRSGYTIVK